MTYGPTDKVSCKLDALGKLYLYEKTSWTKGFICLFSAKTLEKGTMLKFGCIIMYSMYNMEL